MYITTAYNPSEQLIQRTLHYSFLYHMKYVERKKLSIPKLQQDLDSQIIVVTDNTIKYYNDYDCIYFHPNMAMLRHKRLNKNKSDVLIEIADVREGQKILDCTMGLASDSIVLSSAVGHTGKVVALEENPYVHMIVKEGIRNYTFDDEELQKAAQAINMINENYHTYLLEQDDNAFDVVYFDPMFDHDIKEETPLDVLRSHHHSNELTIATIEEAKRVARNCVIMKNHYLSDKFETLGFLRQVRKTSQFHYGIIDVRKL